MKLASSGVAIGPPWHSTITSGFTALAAAARRTRKDVIVLCHGGPIAQPADAAYVIDRCPDCHGFYGASSMERLPTEIALTETTRRFTQISGDRP